MSTQQRTPWLASAVGIGIFLALCLIGFTVMALLAPKVPAMVAPQTIAISYVSAVYAPALISAWQIIA